MEYVFQVLDRYGVSVGVLIATGIAIYKASNWTAPRIDKVINAHVAFVDRVGEQVEKQTSCMLSLAQTQERHSETLDAIHEKLSRV